MYFSGLNADPEQCTIEKGVKKGLYGNVPTPTSVTTRHYSINKFYEPIPIEFLSAADTSP